MNGKEKTTLEGLGIHIEYIREAVDDIKKTTNTQDDKIDKNKVNIAKIMVVGTIVATVITLAIPIILHFS